MRDATPEEIKFCNRLRKLLKQMPSTMAIFADGQIQAIDSKTNASTEGFQPLDGIHSIGNCDGGDPWR